MKQLNTIKKICEEYQITAYEIAKNTALSQPGVQAIINGSVKKPHQESIDKILKYIEDKIGGTNISKSKTIDLTPKLSDIGVPYYSIDFSSGYKFLMDKINLDFTYKISYEPYNFADMWVDNTEKSMEPIIDGGNIIALKHLKDMNQLIYGKIYAVVMEEMRTIKYIRKSSSKDYFKLVPENLTDFDTQEIKKELVQKVYIVLGSIKKLF